MIDLDISNLTAPLPQAGGVGGGQPNAAFAGEGEGRPKPIFKSRDTKRARELRLSATPAERRLWGLLGSRKLGGHKFSWQMPIGPYFADFMCRAAKLVVEIDGYSHEYRQDHDGLRDLFIAEQGYSVLRFSNDDVMANLDGVSQAIAIALAKKSPPPTPPASGRGADSTALLPARLRAGPGMGACEIMQYPMTISNPHIGEKAC